MQDWLNSLEPRERLMVIGCGIFVLVAAIWVFGLQPILQQADGLEARVVDKRAQLANLQELAAQVDTSGPAPAGGAATATQSLVVIIDRTTREKQLAGYLKRNQPEGSTSVRLRFEGAPFDALVTWLGDLNSDYGLTASNANFDRAGPGRVNVSLVLTRSGG
ncbi:MAG: type II secretion system protein M [Gammaproteobacteria bacterium]|nr:type II secretion system protein M [Gammaproteobacteria bacterium]NND54381.1 type II secretion system protein M [Gammaproteobacteria bacterium]